MLRMSPIFEIENKKLQVKMKFLTSNFVTRSSSRHNLATQEGVKRDNKETGKARGGVMIMARGTRTTPKGGGRDETGSMKTDRAWEG